MADFSYSKYYSMVSKTFLVNIYGPNWDKELVAFYLSLLQTIVKNDFETIENIIMGGDFNCPLNPTVEKKKWKPFLKAICN